MRLSELFPGHPAPAEDPEVVALAYATDQVKPGALFFCVPGFTRDGHEFAPAAIERGAVALVVERPLHSGVPEVQVPSVRAAMATAAAAFYGEPTRRLATVGITGTNGKTTTAFLTRALLEADGRRCGLLGTVKSVVGGAERDVVRTTPEAVDLQRTFQEMLDAGDEAVVLEVSSHALELHRADAIDYDVAVFTNLTQDHLDFHPTMEDYFNAKRKLFTALTPRHSVINLDDDYGRRLAREVERPITYSLERPEASYQAVGLSTGLDGSRFSVRGPDGTLELVSPLRGRFNVLNVLAALAAARALGVPAAVAQSAIATAGQVPGRFETVDAGQPFAVIVDYAHTPDSLENVLSAARRLTESGHRLHVVFGAGGDRDRGKRPLMGAIASRLADRVIVTSDNPRSEDPAQIIDEILAGIAPEDRGHVEDEVDRRRAIAAAVAAAAPGDVVVIAGKGHEQGQEFERGRKIPFDDVTVAREAIHKARPAS